MVDAPLSGGAAAAASINHEPPYTLPRSPLHHSSAASTLSSLSPAPYSFIRFMHIDIVRAQLL